MGDGVDTEEAKKEVHNRHRRFTTTVARNQSCDGRVRVYEVIERDGWDVREKGIQVHRFSILFLPPP